MDGCFPIHPPLLFLLGDFSGLTFFSCCIPDAWNPIMASAMISRIHFAVRLGSAIFRNHFLDSVL